MSDAFPAVLRSRAVVLRLDNVDTDVITPIARVLQGREAVARYAFEPLRFAADGTPLATDPFADPERQGAQILLAGRNFGCGSSRETAAWALRDLGFRAVIAPSFGDIFASNCLKNGVLALGLDAATVARLMRAADALAELEVRFEPQTVACGDLTADYAIGAVPKQLLRNGLDEIGLMLGRAGAQARHEAADAIRRPWVRGRTRAAPS